MKYNKLLILPILFSSLNCWAGEASIKAAYLNQQGPETYQISVTLHHQDTGWEHYADAWRVIDKQGNIIATRTLFHPHVDEQPFTRSLNNVPLKKELKTVYIEAHDNVHGWSPERLEINLADLQNGKLTVKNQ